MNPPKPCLKPSCKNGGLCQLDDVIGQIKTLGTVYKAIDLQHPCSFELRIDCKRHSYYIKYPGAFAGQYFLRTSLWTNTEEVIGTSELISRLLQLIAVYEDDHTIINNGRAWEMVE